uniref:Uncharacterized protein n=1 Tax=Rhizophora mucronata TaxID=61149 RepID=A0A2P2PXG4_RHIMU
MDIHPFYYFFFHSFIYFLYYASSNKMNICKSHGVENLIISNKTKGKQEPNEATHFHK